MTFQSFMSFLGLFNTIEVSYRSPVQSFPDSVGNSIWRMLRYSCYSSKTFYWDIATVVNTNDRLGVNGTVATVAVARGVSNPIETPFGVCPRFALVGGTRAKVERTYSEPTPLGFQRLIWHKP